MKDGPSPKSLSTSVTVEPLDDDIDVNGRNDNDQEPPSTSIGLLRQVRHSGNDLETKTHSNGDLNSIELKQLNKPNNRVRQTKYENIFIQTLKNENGLMVFVTKIFVVSLFCVSEGNCYFVPTQKTKTIHRKT